MTPKLIGPCPEYAASYAEALCEGLYPDEDTTAEVASIVANFDAWLADKMDMEKLVKLPDGTKVKKAPAT